VGIAEEHLITTAAGMAAAGLRPYVGIYSTFLQRAYDQLIHDVCLEKLPVTLLIDRGGLVGQDGATHQGVYDLSYLRQMPGMIVASPRDVRDLKRLMRLSMNLDCPMAIRYPKSGEDMGARLSSTTDLKVGEWESLLGGQDILILAVGRMVRTALRVAIDLLGLGYSCGVTDARFIKPMDEEKLRDAAQNHKLLVTLEDNALAGGFGSGVAEWLCDHGMSVPLLRLGVPDRFIEYGTVSEQTEECGLDADSVKRAILERLPNKQ
jgi:1-deoxy-D-xylulose-5-phosphate synthase